MSTGDTIIALLTLAAVLAICMGNVKEKDTAYGRFMAMYPFILAVIVVAYCKFH
jgi:hypothetical protein